MDNDPAIGAIVLTGSEKVIVGLKIQNLRF